MASKPTYHFISHSHWDREWYKPFETFRLDLVDMINTLLDIFATNPDYKHFTLDGQTIVLEDYAEVMPERVNDLKRLIDDGRVSIGPWYILPDEFLVSGESTVRNLHFGKKAAQGFGKVMQVGYIPDSFGHLAMMPAILRGFDMDTAIVYRGFGGEPGQEKSEYRWQSPDSSEVLMIHLPPNGYSDAYIGIRDPQAYTEKAHQQKEVLDPRATTLHRICMNGGDHHFPESFLPEALQVMNKTVDGNFIHSSIPAYIQAVKDDLEKNRTQLNQLKGELRWGFRYAFAVQSGVFSSRIYLKQANRKTEKLLTRYVEPLAIWATLAGRPTLNNMIHQSWKLLLQNHPHDSICGCSIDSVHREMMSRFEKCEQIGEAVIEKSLHHFYPDSEAGQEKIFVFNPLLRKSNCPIETAIEFFRQKIIVGLNPSVNPEPLSDLISGFKIKDYKGNEVPFQITKHEEDAHGLRYSNYSYPSKRLVERFELLLDAQDTPGLGFSTYFVEPAESFPAYISNLKATDNFLENDLLRVEVKPDGAFDIYDKRNHHWLRDMHIFEDGGDAGDEYNYSYPARDRILTSKDTKSEITLTENGPLRATIQIRKTLVIPKSLDADCKVRISETVDIPILTEIRLYHNQPWLECETTIENIANDHRLRVLFPTGMKTNTSYADSQFCITKREHLPVENPQDFTIEIPTSVHPMQRGVTITDNQNGLTIATSGLTEYELKIDEPGTLAITLLRCIGRLSGGDLLTRPGGEAGWITETPEAQCHGTHTFRYAIIPHSNVEFNDYGYVNEQIENFLLPSRNQRCSGEKAAKSQQFGLTLSPASLVVSAFKPAENSEGYILRFYNPTAQQVKGELQSALPLNSAYETQLNERDTRQLKVEDRNSVKIFMEPCQIMSLRLFFDVE